MRHTSYVLAALLGLAVPAAGTALAFEVNSAPASKADSASLYTDSDEIAKREQGQEIDPFPNLQFKTGSSSSKRIGGGANNSWQFLQPMGRLTR